MDLSQTQALPDPATGPPPTAKTLSLSVDQQQPCSVIHAWGAASRTWPIMFAGIKGCQVSL